ncbi:hypothetical protein DEU56DRAFT_753232 [Suillus clintonianus]|uniref:uncharacterized protein n=1 Tax=Suillus clintonianus TaxID=1904413 RepID=UPI001B86C3E7|nr:uncharacterized protein DEU56DRAFT_753232 [Suillus clintonianus]KAG2147970.1 hypothetical protein DEU56DRAFT_753232 [Suillus clintonianus]
MHSSTLEAKSCCHNLKKWMACQHPLSYYYKAFKYLLHSIIGDPTEHRLSLPNPTKEKLSIHDFTKLLVNTSQNTSPVAVAATLLSTVSVPTVFQVALRYMYKFVPCDSNEVANMLLQNALIIAANHLHINNIPWHLPGGHGCQYCKPHFESWINLGKASQSLPETQFGSQTIDAATEASQYFLSCAIPPEEFCMDNIRLDKSEPKDSMVQQTYQWAFAEFNMVKPLHQLALLVGMYVSKLIPDLFYDTDNCPDHDVYSTIFAFTKVVCRVPWMANTSHKGCKTAAQFVMMVMVYILASFNRSSPLQCHFDWAKLFPTPWDMKHSHKEPSVLWPHNGQLSIIWCSPGQIPFPWSSTRIYTLSIADITRISQVPSIHVLSIPIGCSEFLWIMLNSRCGYNEQTWRNLLRWETESGRSRATKCTRSAGMCEYARESGAGRAQMLGEVLDHARSEEWISSGYNGWMDLMKADENVGKRTLSVSAGVTTWSAQSVGELCLPVDRDEVDVEIRGYEPASTPELSVLAPDLIHIQTTRPASVADRIDHKPTGLIPSLYHGELLSHTDHNFGPHNIAQMLFGPAKACAIGMSSHTYVINPGIALSSLGKWKNDDTNAKESQGPTSAHFNTRPVQADEANNELAAQIQHLDAAIAKTKIRIGKTLSGDWNNPETIDEVHFKDKNQLYLCQLYNSQASEWEAYKKCMKLLEQVRTVTDGNVDKYKEVQEHLEKVIGQINSFSQWSVILYDEVHPDPTLESQPGVTHL